MRNILTQIIFLTLFLRIVNSVSADFNLQEWKYVKEIQPQSPLEEVTFVQLYLDRDIYQVANPNLADLRIIDNANEEVPYKLVLEKEETQQQLYQPKILNASYLPGEYQFFIAKLGKEGIPHNQIQIQTSSINFRREARIEGSNDQKTWFVLNDKGHLYDYSPPEFEFKKQDTKINYPDSTYRYLKVTIFSRGEEPLVINGVVIIQNIISVADVIHHPIKLLTQTEDKLKKASIIEFDLQKQGWPFYRLVLEPSTSEQNFSREVALEGSNNRKNWQVIVSGDIIFSFQTAKFTGSKQTLEFPETRHRYFRLTIFNQDNPPLQVTGGIAMGLARKLFFEYDSAKNYKLYYGNEKALTPEYDLSAYFKYLDLENPPRLVLGAEKLNTQFITPTPIPTPFTDRFPWLLPLALGIIVLILGTLLFRLIRQAKSAA